MATFSLQLVGALQIAIKMFCVRAMRPVTEHFILKSNAAPAQEYTCNNLEMKGKTQGEVGGRRLQGTTKSRNKGEKRKQEKEETSHVATEPAPPQTWKDRASVLQSYFNIASVV